MQKAILILAAMLAAFSGSGDVSDVAGIHGRVVRIADGDTLTLVTGGSRPVATAPSPAATQHKIRLYGIDAPESHQAFGQKSKHHLSSLVFGKDVRVAYKSRDKYGRILGTVYVDGKDVNLEMIRAGHYKRFNTTPAYAVAESEAPCRDASDGGGSAGRLAPPQSAAQVFRIFWILGLTIFP
ncbi:MAG: thermonuclease family protein [Kiritimatiellae bacterium]|nr:thermonuclease family protein [Kiritimatiellia bacterium]